MIKAIVFDLGGVLIDLDAQRCMDRFRELAGMEAISDILDSSHQKGILGDLETGKIDENEFYNLALPFCKEGTTSQTVRECLIGILGELETDRLELLASLEKEYDIYLLSNNNPIVMSYLEPLFEKKGFPMEKLFRKRFYSYKMKVAKPSPEYFREAIRQIGLPAEEMLFIDDSPINIEAAEKCGMNAQLHVPGTPLGETVENGLKNTSSPA